MGCCLSKKRKEDSNKAKGEKYNSAGSGSRDPPPTESPHEEEKVKEVLSEIPKFTIQSSAAAAKSVDVDNGGAKPNMEMKQADDDIDDLYTEIRSEAESSAAASEQSTTTNYSTFPDVQKARGDEVEEMALKNTRSVLTTPYPAKPKPKPKAAPQIQNRKKKKVNYNQAAPAAAAITSTGTASRREMRGSVVDVGCRSARSSPSPQRRATGGNTAAGAAAMKRSDRTVSPSAMKRSAASSPAMDQRQQCRLMSSSSAATTTTSSRVNNGRYTSLQRIPATARPREQQDPHPDPAANKLLEESSPLDNHNHNHNHDHEHQREESLENPLVSLECFIFL